MEEKAEYKIVSQKNLDEANQLLSREPPIIIEPPRIILEGGTEQGFTERRQSAYIKFSVTFLEVMAKLKGSRLSVFLCLSLHINDKRQCFPGIDTIANETGYSSMQVMRSLKTLEDDGYLTIKRQHRRSNLYTVEVAAAFGYGNDPVPLSNIMLPKSDEDKNLGNMGVTQDDQNVTQNGVLGNMGVTPRRKNQLKEEESTSAKTAQIKPPQPQPSIDDVIKENDVLFGGKKKDDNRERRTDAEHVARTAASLISGERSREELRVVVETEFDINPNWSNKNWSNCLTFLRARPAEMTISKFASWWWNENWQGKGGSPPRADQIMELWPQAFTERKGGQREPELVAPKFRAPRD